MVKAKDRTPAIQRIPVQPTPENRRYGIHSYRIQTNVTLKTLLRQTIRDDPQVRKDAFEGIQDHIKVGHFLSDSFKNNEKAIFEKLCHGITDTDNGVRESAYETLVKVKHCVNFGNYIPTIFVPSVVKALAHSEMDIHLTGRKVTDMILHQLPSSFYLFVRMIFQSLEDMMKKDVYEQLCSLVRLLRIFQSLNVCLKSMPSMPDVGETCEIFFDKKSLEVLKNVLSIFPRSWNQHSNVGDSKYFDVDIEVTRIFFRLPTLSDSEKFLAFISYALHKITESNVEELLAFFPPYVPVLLPDLQSHSQANLIQAFTVGFKLSRLESNFKLACVTAIEVMMSESIIEDADENSELFDKCEREWIEELCKMLPLFGHENKCASQDVLRTLLMASSTTNFEAVEKPLLHQAFCWLFRGSHEGRYCRDSLFYCIPKEMQEKCLRLLQYFPVLDEHLLKSMAHNCVRHGMKWLPEMVSALDQYYRSRQHEQAEGFFLFFSLLVSENEDYKGNSITTLLNKSDTEYMDIILPKLRYDAAELSRFLSVSNHHRSQYVLLRLVAKLDTQPEKSSPEFVASLSNFTSDYMIEVTYLGGENRIDARDHCLSPCFTLMGWNTEFFGLILDEIIKYMEAECSQ
ncbi:uncharacterized protein LOC141647686 [Silene latifolia]|uniref:uncharacterized protein LOC141647686 n=1 Tax=Silene latifolia TaxID=37657 RepID=UPI003D779BD3